MQDSELIDLKRGTVVILKKGAPVRSCNPNKREYVLKRNQKVKVHNTFRPYEGSESWGYPARKGEVSWAGAGGYWCHANFEDVLSIATA